MSKVKAIKSCLGLFILTFPLFSSANCPRVSQIEVLTNKSHIARTEQGIWTQFENSQSYKSTTVIVESLSLYFVFGIDLVYSNNLTSAYDKIACIYLVKNTNSVALQSSENQRYIVLKSPNNQQYVINFYNELGNMNGWNTMRSTITTRNTNTFCTTNKWPIGDERAFHYCGFYPFKT